MASSNSSVVTTSYLLGNLHCPSCVSYIKSLLLEAYGEAISWVSPNLVTSVVTIEHSGMPTTLVQSIRNTLEEAGFEVCGVRTDSKDHPEDDIEPVHTVGNNKQSNMSSAWARYWLPAGASSSSRVRSAADIHVENCKACQMSISNTDGSPDGLSKQNNQQSRPTLSHEGKDANYDDLKEIAVDPEEAATYQATLSIGGMTCAACVRTIKDELEKYDWIENVVINLLTNSGTVQYHDSSHSQDLVQAIEDMGYDAELDKMIQLQDDQNKASDEGRDMEIKIDGMFCIRCAGRIDQTLSTFPSGDITIVQLPTLERSILKIRYTPRAPDFTIRHILEAITAADENISASIYHPPTLEERSKMIKLRHQRQLLQREILTVIIAIPTFILGIVYMSLVPESNPSRQYLMKPWSNGISRNDVALAILATPVYFFAADIFHTRAIKEMRTLWRRGSKAPFLARFYKFGSMNMLMSLGTTIAYISSIIQMIVAGATGEMHLSSDELYFDSVVFLTMFLLAGRLIEAYSKSKTGDAVEALANLRPTTASLIEQDKLSGKSNTKPVGHDLLECGDVVRVPHGSSPPADGVVIEGEGRFDESSLTGESVPVVKKEGDNVYAGTINKSEAIVIRITKIGGNSMLDQIVEVVREGQTKRAPMEQIADTLTTYFVPIITLIALVTFVIWMALAFTILAPEQDTNSSGARVAFAFRFAISVFVVACPCGLALAAPTAIFVGGGLAAQHGILAKGGGEAFEMASKVDCVVFDKTGTLTMGGAPQVTDSVFYVSDIPNCDENRLKSILKGLEENSTHPIASAIVGFCGEGVHSAELEDVQELPGLGMSAFANGRSLEVIAGNERLMRNKGVYIPESTLETLHQWKTEAKSVVLVGAKDSSKPDWTLAAILSISDPLRPEAAPVIKKLRSSGVQVWVLSGDNAVTANAVASRVGVDPVNVLAEVLPSEKASKISYLQSIARTNRKGDRRGMVAMVGDGINDSPALTKADVGIAVGSGSDIAISSAAFVLTTSKLTAVLTLLDLSKVVFRRIKFNFGWAMIYNLLAVPIAAGCLYAVKTGDGSRVTLDPVWASLAMALSSISVILSSLSLRARVPGIGFRAQNIIDRTEA